jgi:hypothetical protein
MSALLSPLWVRPCIQIRAAAPPTRGLDTPLYHFFFDLVLINNLRTNKNFSIYIYDPVRIVQATITSKISLTEICDCHFNRVTLTYLSFCVRKRDEILKIKIRCEKRFVSFSFKIRTSLSLFVALKKHQDSSSVQSSELITRQ